MRLRRPYRANIVRVAMMRKDKSQCLSKCRKEVHNERPIATSRNARSTDRLSIFQMSIDAIARERLPTVQGIENRSARVGLA